jgi:acetyltransferase-like isoleucine patch superfamily enzyme
MGGGMKPAAHPMTTVAPPASLPRQPGWRDCVRARRARRHDVTVGRGVAIGRDVRFDLAPGARLVLHDRVVVGDGSRFHVQGGEVVVGAGTILGERCVITAHERVDIGERCLLADEVVIVDADPRYDDVERPTRLQGVLSAPVNVGDGARLGPGAAVLRGVTVGAGAMVGAHAVLTADVAPGTPADGVPAAPMRRPTPPARPARRARDGAGRR